MLLRQAVSRLLCVATLFFAPHGVTAQRITPAALSVGRDSVPSVAMMERFHERTSLIRVPEDSARSVEEKIGAVLGGALIGGAAGLAVAVVYAPRIFCDICQPGNAPAEARNKYFFRGPMIGIGVGALVGWWLYGR